MIILENVSLAMIAAINAMEALVVKTENVLSAQTPRNVWMKKNLSVMLMVLATNKMELLSILINGENVIEMKISIIIHGQALNLKVVVLNQPLTRSAIGTKSLTQNI